jgi:hypothetical protein
MSWTVVRVIQALLAERAALPSPWAASFAR